MPWMFRAWCNIASEVVMSVLHFLMCRCVAGKFWKARLPTVSKVSECSWLRSCVGPWSCFISTVLLVGTAIVSISIKLPTLLHAEQVALYTENYDKTKRCHFKITKLQLPWMKTCILTKLLYWLNVCFVALYLERLPQYVFVCYFWLRHFSSIYSDILVHSSVLH